MRWRRFARRRRQLPDDDSSDDNRDDSEPLNYAPYSAKTRPSCLFRAPARSWQCGGHLFDSLRSGPKEAWAHRFTRRERNCRRWVRELTAREVFLPCEHLDRLLISLPELGASGIKAFCVVGGASTASHLRDA
jgi:hypothetical protein